MARPIAEGLCVPLAWRMQSQNVGRIFFASQIRTLSRYLLARADLKLKVRLGRAPSQEPREV
jgi:hypothetical protein